MKRVIALLPVLLAFQAGVPPALAWTWPATGRCYDPSSSGTIPTPAGSIAASTSAAPVGALVRAPAGGTVSFAGTVPGGRPHRRRSRQPTATRSRSSTSAQSPSRAARRSPRATASARPVESGEPEHAEPYVHLGVRVDADPNGYVDPLALLPSRQAPPPPSPAPPEAQVPERPSRRRRPSSERSGASRRELPAPSPPAGALRSATEPAATPVREALSRGAGGSGRQGRGHRARPGRGGAESRSARRSRGRSSAASRSRRTLALGRRRRAVRQASATERGRAGRQPRSAALPLSCLRGFGGLVLAVAEAISVAQAPQTLRPRCSVDRAARAAEDAAVAWTAEEDGLVADGDLERVSLAEPEPLPDLDRDHDAPELVQVADDPRCRLPASATRRRFHHVCLALLVTVDDPPPAARSIR